MPPGDGRACAAAVLALLLPAACRVEGAAAAPRAITVHVGEQFTIRLDANATTGYGWRLTTPPAPAVATLVGSTYQASGDGLVGSGGDELWTFRATGAGATRIVLGYVRPWEHDVPPIRTHAVDVRVEKAPAP
jgi:inhibitor of cysteine peptidase